MKKTSTLILLMLTASYSFANSDFKPSKYQCSGIEQRIEKINSRMRAGYSTKEGEQLKEQLRSLKKQRNECKKKGFSVD
ncbi:hypothetical protein [Alteromonas sp. KUL106]|uniref:hypothetical protein n=1 Tax=Alteromonas sp. KUL106 TaxID=2480799 RepID=UPI00135B00DB|nr:hypothetical protein [Alteromonas sp. KUL106]